MATAKEEQPTAVPETENGHKESIDHDATDRMVKGEKRELQDADAWEVLGYSFSTWRKW
jgi:hypothetical protein